MICKKKCGRLSIILGLMTGIFIATYMYMLKLNLLRGGRYLFSQPSSHIFHNLQRVSNANVEIDEVSKLRMQSNFKKARTISVKEDLIAQKNIKPVFRMTWANFTKLPDAYGYNDVPPSIDQWSPKICSLQVESRLLSPRLSQEEHDWCVYANSIQIKTIKFKEAKMSWKLYMSHLRNYTKLSCHYVTVDNKHDSCSHLYGDLSFSDYTETLLVMTKTQCNPDSTSMQLCTRNRVNQTFCEIKNAMIDFSQFTPVNKVNRKGKSYLSKDFQSNFLSSDCHSSTEINKYNTLASETVPTDQFVPLYHLYSPTLSAGHCDYIHQGNFCRLNINLAS